MTLLVGIDPGFTGAIALLDPDTWELQVHDMPVFPGANGKTETDCHAVGRLLSIPPNGRQIAVLEKVWAFQGQGISSAFRFGDCYGALRMAVIGHGFEIANPTPRTWKKHFGLNAKKPGSRKLATERFPNNATDFALVKDHGRAEAALLALWGIDHILKA